MSKTLLTEAEIRKMMGLANLRPLGNAFMARLDEQEMEEPEEAPEGEEPEEEAPEGEEPPVEDPEAGEPGEDEGMEGAIEQVMSAVVDALNSLPGAPSVSIETEEGGEEMGPEAEMDMGPEAEEAEADVPPSPEAGPEGAEDEAEALMESLEAAGVFLDEGDYMEDDMMEGDYMEDDMMEDDFMDEDYLEEEMGLEGDDDLGPVGMELEEEELVNEVTRRVGRRLAQRISKRTSRKR